MLSQMEKVHYFLWLSKISVFVYHTFFIHSCIIGHLGYFHILSVLNNAAMNIDVHISFQITVFVVIR